MFLVLIVSFLASVGYSFYLKLTPTVDARGYNNIARHLVAGQGYREFLNKPFLEEYGITRSGPGYEFFLAAVYWLFGYHLGLIWILQALMHTLTGLLIYLLARKIFTEIDGKITGLIGVIGYLFYIDVFEKNSVLLTETLYIFLFTLTLYAVFVFLEKKKISAIFWSGLLATLTTLVRPTGLAFVLLLIIFILFIKDIDWRKKIIYSAILILIPLFLIGPWTYRNYRIYDTFILTSGNGGYDLWVGNHHGASGEMEPTAEMTEYITKHGVKATEEKGVAEYFSFIKNYPGEFIVLQFKKASIFFSLIRPIGWWPHLGAVGKTITLSWSVLFAVLLFILGAAGFHLLIKNHWPDNRVKFLIITALLIPASVIPFAVETRYRFSLYVPLALSAGYFLASFFQQKEIRQKLTKTLIVSFSIFVANSAIDIVFNFDRIKDYLERLN